MKQLTLCHLDHCPYCRNARRAIEALKAENPAFEDLEIEWVEESRHPERTQGRDYYYVPTLYDGDRKLYEARPGQDYEEIREHLRAAFDAALAQA